MSKPTKYIPPRPRSTRHKDGSWALIGRGDIVTSLNPAAPHKVVTFRVDHLVETGFSERYIGGMQANGERIGNMENYCRIAWASERGQFLEGSK
jgi:hypothetical protein